MREQDKYIKLIVKTLPHLNEEGIKALYNLMARFYSYSCYEGYRNKDRALDRQSATTIKYAVTEI